MRSTPLLTEAQPLDGLRRPCPVRTDGTTADVDLSYLLDYGGVKFGLFRDAPTRAALPLAHDAGVSSEPNARAAACHGAHAMRGSTWAGDSTSGPVTLPLESP